MRIAIVLILFSTTLLVGCAGPGKMNELSVGMTKGQVIEVLGQPRSISAKGNVEYLNYNLYAPFDADRTADSGPYVPYFVRLIDGKVEAYGKRGDFDSTKPPETKTTIDLNIKGQ